MWSCRHDFAASRRISPELCVIPRSPKKRAQGRPGADWHPRSAARNAHAKKTAQQHTGVADHSAFPARWSDGLCRALPGAELSFWPPSPRELTMPSARLGSRTSPRRLDRSNDGQDHTVLPYAFSAVRPHAVSSSQGLPALPAPSRADAAASTATRPALRTTREPPLFVGRAVSTYAAIPNFGKVEYFCAEGLTGVAGVLPDGTRGFVGWVERSETHQAPSANAAR